MGEKGMRRSLGTWKMAPETESMPRNIHRLLTNFPFVMLESTASFLFTSKNQGKCAVFSTLLLQRRFC